jgi:import inner membrane translocase subunit TIM17
MGAIGGALWHGLIMGWRNAPRGMRVTSLIQSVKARAPALGGSFAAWGGLYSGFECSLSWARRKEDYKSSIMAGGLTGGVLAAKSGVRGTIRSGMMGAALLSLIEGVVFVLTRQSAAEPGMMPPIPPPTDVLDEEEAASDWRARLRFWGKKEEEEKKEAKTKSEGEPKGLAKVDDVFAKHEQKEKDIFGGGVGGSQPVRVGPRPTWKEEEEELYGTSNVSSHRDDEAS